MHLKQHHYNSIELYLDLIPISEFQVSSNADAGISVSVTIDLIDSKLQLFLNLNNQVVFTTGQTNLHIFLVGLSRLIDWW